VTENGQDLLMRYARRLESPVRRSYALAYMLSLLGKAAAPEDLGQHWTSGVRRDLDLLASLSDPADTSAVSPCVLLPTSVTRAEVPEEPPSLPKSRKQAVYDRLHILAGLPTAPLGPGSKEHKEVFAVLAAEFSLDLLTKERACQGTVEAAGLGWTPECHSAGGTISTIGLERFEAAVKVLRARPAARKVLRLSGAEASALLTATSAFMTSSDPWSLSRSVLTLHAALASSRRVVPS
jgi:hypothetical protein